MDHHTSCTVPFRFGRRIGDSWLCPVCGSEWVVQSNQYDSLLPFGDYTWFTTPPPATGLERFFGTRPRRAVSFQAEPVVEDRSRMTSLFHVFGSLGLDRSMILSIWDENESSMLPYHGAAHGVTVSLRSFEDGVKVGLDREALRVAALAGLFHDADYVPGDDDAANVERAAEFAARRIPTQSLRENVSRVILSTRFPHQSPSDTIEAVVQDADLLQGFESDRSRWLHALLEETGREASEDFPTPEMLNTEVARRRLARRGK